jgi:LPXTG-motif cell wall-anchored protein
LPMTGYQTSRELQTAAGLLLLGSLLCGLASIRRRTTD